MKNKAMFTTMFFAASLLSAGGALATDQAQTGQDHDKYGATSTTDRYGATSDSADTMEKHDSLGASDHDMKSKEGVSATTEQERETSGQFAATDQMGQQQKQIQSAEDLKNFSVQDSQGEKLGQISQVLIDTQTGQVGYAVVSSGGVLGMGEEKYIVPFNALKTGQQGQTFTLDVSKDQLKQAPHGDIQQAMDREKGREIHQFYGVSPYWEEGGAQQQMNQPQMNNQPMNQPQTDQQQPGQSIEQQLNDLRQPGQMDQQTPTQERDRM